MFKAIKALHIIALCVFVGSIPSHIILGALAQAADGAEAFALYHQAKYTLTVALTASGLLAAVLSGLLLALLRKPVFRQRWLQAKLLAVGFIVANGLFFLSPLAGELADLATAAATSGTLDARFAELSFRESIAGAANLVAILLAILLAAVKPRLGQAAPAFQTRGV